MFLKLLCFIFTEVKIDFVPRQGKNKNSINIICNHDVFLWIYIKP